MVELVSLILLLAVLVVVYVLYQRKQRELMEDALELACLLCDSADVEVLSVGATDHYQCRQCGYHTDLATRPATAALVETFRDIKRAAEYLRDAEALLREPSYEPGTMNAMSGESDEELEARVNGQIQSGLSLLGDLSTQHPELLEIPSGGDISGEPTGGSRRLTDILPLSELNRLLVPANWGRRRERKRVARGAVQLSAWIGSLEAFRDDYARYVLLVGGEPNGG